LSARAIAWCVLLVICFVVVLVACVVISSSLAFFSGKASEVASQLGDAPRLRSPGGKLSSGPGGWEQGLEEEGSPL